MRARSSILLSIALLIATPAAASKESRPDGNTATLTTYNISGIGGRCSQLYDVSYTLANGAFYRNAGEDYDVGIEHEYYQELREQYKRAAIGLVVQKRAEKEGAGAPAVRIFSLASGFSAEESTFIEEEIERGIQQYGNARWDRFVASMRGRGDTNYEPSSKFFTTTNNRIRESFVRSQSRDTCYAAALLTAFKHFKMATSYSDLVQFRKGMCPKIKTFSKDATFIEIVTSAYSAALGKPSEPYSWMLPSGNLLAFARRRYQQSSINGQVFEAGYKHAWFKLDLSPVIAKLGIPQFNYANSATTANTGFSAANLIPQQPSRDADEWHGPRTSNGDMISLWGEANWYRKADPSIGGHIRPIQSTADLIVALLNGEVIVVGLQRAKAAHTVLVTGLKYEARLLFSQSNALWTERSALKDIRVLDPAGGPNPEYWIQDIDAFLRDYRFGISIVDGVKQN